MEELAITLGVEEEYFLVDPSTRGAIPDPSPGILETCLKNKEGHNFTPELLRSQLEASSGVCGSISEVRDAIVKMRSIAIAAAKNHDAELLACAVHPFSVWSELLITEKERYESLMINLQSSVMQLLAGGLHIHAGFGDENLRIAVLTAMRRYLPVLLALSTSSPFSSGSLTGFKSYRHNLIGNLPRTGIPAPMYAMSQYNELLESYKSMRFVNDGSEIWWDIRPSHAFPTIELRICDICPSVEDTMCVVAIYACLIRCLARLIKRGAAPPEPPTEIIEANKWLAQRYGVFAFLGDTRDGGMVDMLDVVERIILMIRNDALALGCETEVLHARRILRNGSSADRQADHYRLLLLEGATNEDAIRSVVDFNVAETAQGVS